MDARAPFKYIPVVAPVSNDPNTSGKVRNLAVGGGVNHSQIEAVYDAFDRDRVIAYELRAGARARGWSKLQDLYEAEEGGKSPGWARYKAYLDDMRADRTRSPFPTRLLPQEVQRRMKAAIPDPWADDEAELDKLKNGTAQVVAGKPVDEPAKPEAKPADEPKRKARPEVPS